MINHFIKMMENQHMYYQVRSGQLECFNWTSKKLGKTVRINSNAQNGYEKSSEIYALTAAVICQFGVVCVPRSLQMM